MKALIIIDYVNDFVADNGKLTCGKPAQEIDNNIVKVVNEFIKNNDLIVIASDNHSENDSYSIESKLFPPHCIKGTPGAELYGETAKAVKHAQNKIFLNKQKYSAFFGTGLDLMLRQRNIKEVFLSGVCSDICVLHTAIHAYNLEYKITVYENCVASFNPEGHTFALKHMKGCLGANIINV